MSANDEKIYMRRCCCTQDGKAEIQLTGCLNTLEKVPPGGRLLGDFVRELRCDGEAVRGS